MNNAICGKSMENLRNRINLQVANNKKGYFKIYIKTMLYVTQNI